MAVMAKLEDVSGYNYKIDNILKYLKHFLSLVYQPSGVI